MLLKDFNVWDGYNSLVADSCQSYLPLWNKWFPLLGCWYSPVCLVKRAWLTRPHWVDNWGKSQRKILNLMYIQVRWRFVPNQVAKTYYWTKWVTSVCTRQVTMPGRSRGDGIIIGILLCCCLATPGSPMPSPISHQYNTMYWVKRRSISSPS